MKIELALEHSYTNYKSNNDATCEADGTKTAACDFDCGEKNTIKDEGTKLDHIDENNDGKCDTCGNKMTGGDHCKYCGKIHGGAFGWIVKIFHSIFAIFKH